MTLHPDVEMLAATLKTMAEALRSQGNDFWADKVTHCRQIIERSDFHGVQKLLSLYGGMGSLSDIILENDLVHRAFARQRASAYEQAVKLKREEDLRRPE